MPRANTRLKAELNAVDRQSGTSPRKVRAATSCGRCGLTDAWRSEASNDFWAPSGRFWDGLFDDDATGGFRRIENGRPAPEKRARASNKGGRRNTFLAVHFWGMPSLSESIAARFVEDAGFLSTNLTPDHTGIVGAVVWIFAGEFSHDEAQDGPRVLVVPGRELGVASLTDAVAVTVASPPEVLGCLPDEIEPQVIEWVERNRVVVLEYWQGKMATDDAIERLVRV